MRWNQREDRFWKRLRGKSWTASSRVRGSAALGLAWLDFGGILVHGLIFGLLVIGAQMYVDNFAPAELRNQAQGLVMLITGGVGVFASNFVFQNLLNANVVKKVVDGKEVVLHDWAQPFLVALVAAVVLTALMAVCFNPKKASK